LTNHINNLTDQLASLTAERDSLLEGLTDLLAYLQSEKFAGPGPLTGYVNTADIVVRVAEMRSNASLAGAVAYTAAAGPMVADGSHDTCSHGTYPGVPLVNGWHCPVCGSSGMASAHSPLRHERRPRHNRRTALPLNLPHLVSHPGRRRGVTCKPAGKPG
jgi:hypothetical protein